MSAQAPAALAETTMGMSPFAVNVWVWVWMWVWVWVWVWVSVSKHFDMSSFRYIDD
jgi:hypothetical protein